MDLHLEHDFTFNPDGSGRVRVRWSGPCGPDTPAPDEFLRGELQQATGVDAWSDVACGVEDGRLVFTATAWFPDAAALRFHCQGFHCNVLDFAVTPSGDGEVMVATQRQVQPMFESLPDGADADTVRGMLASEREKLTMARSFLDELFGGLRCTAILRLPGRLAEPCRGERLADNAVQVQFEGRQLVEVIDRLLRDDGAMLQLMQQGDTSPDAALELLGDHGPVRLCTEGGAAPQFDYAGEVAAARETYAELLQTSAPLPRLPETGAPLAEVRVLATKLVREADSERGLHPMGQNFTGLSITIAGDLPQPALRVEQASYDLAVTDDGTDLAPPDEWRRRISFPRLTEDGRTVFFDVDLQLPPAGSTGLASLCGRVQILCALGESDVDLGFAELQPDAEGSVHGARLRRCEEADGRWSFEVELQLARERVLALRLCGGGEAVTLRQCGYSSSGDECTLQYEHEGELPPDARLVATLVTELQPVEVPFQLPAVDWSGNRR